MIPFGPSVGATRHFTVEDPSAPGLVAKLNRLLGLFAQAISDEEFTSVFVVTFDVAGSGDGGTWLATVALTADDPLLSLDTNDAAAIIAAGAPGAPGAFFVGVEQAGKTDIALPPSVVTTTGDTTTGRRLDQAIAATVPAPPQGFATVLYDTHGAGCNSGQRFLELSLVAYRVIPPP